MQAPERIDPKRLGDYLEVMSKAIFQAGVSWKVVESKGPGIRQAFKSFDAEAVAALTLPDLDRLTDDPRVIRNRLKLEAIVTNAEKMVKLDREYGSFRTYLRSHGDFAATVKDLHKQFKFMGAMGTYYFLYVVGE